MKIKPGYKQTEAGVIPADWDVKTLGELGSTYGGLTGKTKADFGVGKGQYITFMNVMSNVVIDCAIFGQVNVAPTESQNRVVKGDLLFNGSSETPEEVAMCAILAADVPNLFLNSFCFGFRFRDGAEADGLFISYYLRSKEGRELIKSIAQGSTRYNMSKSALLKAPLCLPSLSEQTAIATALSDVDALLDGLDRLVAKKRAIKLATMQQLLTGKTRMPGFRGKWVTSKISELCEYEFGIATSGGEQEYVEIGDIDVVSKSYDIGGKDKPAIRGAVKVPKGTLLISTVRPTRGAIAITKEEIHVSPAFCRLRPANGFLFHLVCQAKFFAYLGDNSFGGTYPTCRDDTILNYECPVPGNPEEQTAIAAVLSDMDDEIAAIEARRDKTRALKYAMMGELLTGKTRLVPPKQKETNA